MATTLSSETSIVVEVTENGGNAAITNIYSKATGNLIIEKNVTGITANDVPTGTELTYNFTVTNTATNKVENVSVTVDQTVTPAGAANMMQGSETVVLELGTYKVEEVTNNAPDIPGFKLETPVYSNNGEVTLQ